MGRYIAYKRRKIKRTKEDASTDGARTPQFVGTRQPCGARLQGSNSKEPAPSNRRARYNDE